MFASKFVHETIVKYKLFNIFKPAYYNYASFKALKLTWVGKLPTILVMPGLWLLFFGIYLLNLILIVYKSAVWLILKARHGDRFYRFLDSADVMMMLGDPNARVFIHLLLFIEIKDDKSVAEFNQFARARISATFSEPKLEKFRVLWRQFAGYYYYERANFNCDDCIHELKYDGKLADLEMKLNDLANRPMPHDNSGMWEVYIGQSVMQENGCVPILFRSHHSLADGASLCELFAREVSPSIQNFKSCEKNIESHSNWDVDHNRYYDPVFHNFPLMDKKETNYYTSQTLSGKKILTWFCDNSSHYLNTIKSIKNRYENVAYVDVVMAAFSTALMQLAKQAGKNAPLAKEITNMSVVKKGVVFEYGQNPNYTLNNNMGVFLIKMPLESITDNVEHNLYIEMEKRLQIINAQHNIIKHHSVDVDFSYFISEFYLSILPLFPMRYIFSLFRPTTLVSNLPGCKLLHFFGDDLIKEFIFFTPNFAETSVSLMSLTYDGRFRCGFTLDSATFNQEEAEQLRKMFLECLDIFSQKQ